MSQYPGHQQRDVALDSTESKNGVDAVLLNKLIKRVLLHTGCSGNQTGPSKEYLSAGMQSTNVRSAATRVTLRTALSSGLTVDRHVTKIAVV